MAFLRSDEDIQQEIEQLEKELVNYPSGPTRRKIKERIARLKRVDRERINVEKRHRKMGMKKREPKTIKSKVQVVKRIIMPKAPVVDMEDYIRKELAFIKADERVSKEKRAEKKKKIYCSRCHNKCVGGIYTSIAGIIKNQYFCQKCSKNIYGAFKIDL